MSRHVTSIPTRPQMALTACAAALHARRLEQEDGSSLIELLATI